MLTVQHKKLVYNNQFVIGDCEKGAVLLKVNISIQRTEKKNTISVLLKSNIWIRRRSPGGYKFYYVPIVSLGPRLPRESGISQHI